MTVKLPSALLVNENGESTGALVPLPLRPSMSKATSFFVGTVTNSTVVDVEVPVGATLATISAEGYGVHYKWKTPTDSDDVENVTGGKCLGKVIPNTKEDECVVAEATYLSLIGGRGSSYVTISFR